MDKSLDHHALMTEAVSILRGEAAGWKGDRIENAEFWCRTLRNDMETGAVWLAQDLIDHATDWSDELGISPDRVRWFAYRLDPMKSPVTQYYRDRANCSHAAKAP